MTSRLVASLSAAAIGAVCAAPATARARTPAHTEDEPEPPPAPARTSPEPAPSSRASRAPARADEPPPDLPPAPPPAPPPEPPPEEERRPRPSAGRAIVVAYNAGLSWALAPGVVFAQDKSAFFLALRFGYGIDTRSVIVVPGIQAAGYFTDPNVFTGVPLVRLVYPIDRFAPYVEGGAGVGHVAASTSGDSRSSSQDGLAVLAGAGFTVHFTPAFGLGAAGSYQAIAGTHFRGFGVGPVLAIGF